MIAIQHHHHEEAHWYKTSKLKYNDERMARIRKRNDGTSRNLVTVRRKTWDGSKVLKEATMMLEKKDNHTLLLENELAKEKRPLNFAEAKTSLYNAPPRTPKFKLHTATATHRRHHDLGKLTTPTVTMYTISRRNRRPDVWIFGHPIRENYSM